MTGYAQGQAPPADSGAPSNAAPEAQAPPASAAPAAAPGAAEAQAPPANAAPGPAPGAATAEDLQQLVSPIALYPDLLLARILAASTYPDQVVDAHKWLQENQKLPHDQLKSQVNGQPWDPSIKSLCQFPQVLQTMNDNLAWTSALGEAYYNQPEDVMGAVQTMRNRAVEAGTLKSTPQQKIETQPAEAAPAPAEGGRLRLQPKVEHKPRRRSKP